jgi:hypothetical protein
MRPDYAIGAKNGLLEQKHLDALGPAIWLYLWFIDKQPKNTNKVLGGKPVTYQMFAESFPQVPRITYVRWLEYIRKGGYIDLLRTPRGYVVAINKPKKWVNSDVSQMQHHNKSDVSNLNSDVSKTIHAEDVSKMDIQYKRNSLKKQRVTNNTTNVVLADAEKIGILYYQVIRKLNLPVRNHNNVKSTIKKLQAENNHEANIKYLEFMLNHFEEAIFDYKPHVNESLEVYTKRNQIINSAKKSMAKPKGRGFTVKSKR